MHKYLILSSIIILIIYYISTFIISFALLTKSVVNNDSVSLKQYIDVKSLRNNFYEDIYEFNSNLINKIKNIKIKSESIELTGELTPAFLQKLFSKLSNNISRDFSNPEIMLYFYFNSDEIEIYLNKSFTYFGDYNFQKYLLDKDSDNVENNESKQKTEDKKDEEIESEGIEGEEVYEKKEDIISKLIKRIRSTDYFFLTSPIHFKIDVKHQDIPFIIILKFNGLTWKIQKITIPYKKLIDPKKITFSN